MDVTAYIVDWNEVVTRYRAGSLSDDVMEAWENDEAWIRDLEFGTDSDSAYIAIAQAYEELREALTPDVRTVSDSFFIPLITLDGYHQDLKDGGAMFTISVNPESAARFAAIAERLDLESLRAAFSTGCSQKSRTREKRNLFWVLWRLMSYTPPTMRCSEPGHCVQVTIERPRGPGR